MNRDRRGTPERRGRDTGPPSGCFERRRGVERRLPAAVEAMLSAEDFAKFFGPVGARSPDTNHQLDLAADIFERARDRYR
ncbi:MAG: hypothetical protein KJ716_13895 [Gammaproteobacteria bacterium]|nr:hypothetical protein [Gammaproteobacteria bacterium]MBU2447960.1 hypothetical protein [Gammaproteobacteria bacterium]